jgi:hypothetical protein
MKTGDKRRGAATRAANDSLKEFEEGVIPRLLATASKEYAEMTQKNVQPFEEHRARIAALQTRVRDARAKAVTRLLTDMKELDALLKALLVAAAEVEAANVKASKSDMQSFKESVATAVHKSMASLETEAAALVQARRSALTSYIAAVKEVQGE